MLERLEVSQAAKGHSICQCLSKQLQNSGPCGVELQRIQTIKRQVMESEAAEALQSPSTMMSRKGVMLLLESCRAKSNSDTTELISCQPEAPCVDTRLPSCSVRSQFTASYYVVSVTVTRDMFKL